MKTRTWNSVRASRLGRAAIAQAKQRARTQIDEMTLSELRRGLNLKQVEAAQSMEMTQSELSRLEARADHRISTLRRYVEALGGRLEVTAVFGERRVKLSAV